MFLPKQFFNTALLNCLHLYKGLGGGGDISFDISLWGGHLSFAVARGGRVKYIESGAIKNATPPQRINNEHSLSRR